MIIAQAHKEFQVFLDKVDSQALPDFLPQEIDIFLHEAELRIVKQRYGRNNIYKQGWQESQKRSDDLTTLVKKELIPFIDNQATLPEDYMFYAASRVKILKDTNIVYSTPSLTSLDKLNVTRKDPFNKSTISIPVIYQTGSSICIDSEDFTPTDLELTYIKYPRKVDKINQVDSELPEHLQKEAIQLAITIALESIESNRLGTQGQLLNTIE